jgi:hypothetical protein
MLPRSVAVLPCHLEWRTLLKCNKTNHACLCVIIPSDSLSDYLYLCLAGNLRVCHMCSFILHGIVCQYAYLFCLSE